MQILDIQIVPASEADAASRVRFIGEGGDEIAVTIANHHNGGASIDQELVAKAKVMLLHAAAAQSSDRAISEPEIVPLPEVAEEDGSGIQSLEEEQDNPFQQSDEALPDDDAEAQMARDMTRSRGRFEA
jgi:hypothetical protein